MGIVMRLSQTDFPANCKCRVDWRNVGRPPISTISSLHFNVDQNYGIQRCQFHLYNYALSTNNIQMTMTVR